MRIFVEYEGHPHPVRQMELAVSPQDTIDHVRALVENFLDTSTQLREFCVAGRLQEASSVALNSLYREESSQSLAAKRMHCYVF